MIFTAPLPLDLGENALSRFTNGACEASFVEAKR